MIASSVDDVPYCCCMCCAVRRNIFIISSCQCVLMNINRGITIL